MTLPDRSQVRVEFAALLKAALVGEGKLVQALYPYSIGDLAGQSPVVVVGSGGAERKRLTPRTGRAAYVLEVWIFVLYAELDKPNPDGVGPLKLGLDGQPVWDEADSELALDQIEAQVGELLSSSPRGASWKSVDYAGPSTVDIIPIGGIAYRRELVPLRFEVF